MSIGMLRRHYDDRYKVEPVKEVAPVMVQEETVNQPEEKVKRKNKKQME